MGFEQRQMVILLLYLTAASWQDMKKKSIGGWTFLLAAGAAVLDWAAYVFAEGGEVPFVSLAAGCGIGSVLLLLGKISDGAIGEGDGWSFVVTGIILGVWRNTELLFYGMMIGGSYAAGVFCWGKVHGKDLGKRTFPWIPCILPAGIWIAWKGMTG